MNISSCGINCDECKFKAEQNYTGCHAHKGQPFWGICDLYVCADGKDIPHCGKCNEFPCKKLIEAHKGENSDVNGIEIENLKELVAAEK